MRRREICRYSSPSLSLWSHVDPLARALTPVCSRLVAYYNESAAHISERLGLSTPILVLATRLYHDSTLHHRKLVLCTVNRARGMPCTLPIHHGQHLQAALEVLGTGLARKAAPSQSLTRAISSLKERMAGAEEAPTGPKVILGL